MNWKNDFIKFVNKLSKKRGWKCDDMNPYFYQIDLLHLSNAKTLREYKKQQKRKRVNNMAKKYLVKFNCIVGEYEHLETYIFDKQMTEYKYCKKFWGLSKKNELKTNVFWDDFEMNAIEVYSETEITKNQANNLKELGVA